jgi:hypothetical protein
MYSTGNWRPRWRGNVTDAARPESPGGPPDYWDIDMTNWEYDVNCYAMSAVTAIESWESLEISDV